jgi:hypothetical protein
MARRRLLCGAVLVLLWPVSAIAADRSPSGIDVELTVLTIAMADDCPASAAVIAIARAEATRIWSRSAVRLRWVAASELPFASPKSGWLLVQCSTGPLRGVASNEGHLKAVATIRFVGAQPLNVITLSPQNAMALLDQDARRGWLSNHELPAARHLRLGRMLGRALAHEIGHFLSQSEAHTERGLMKRTHSVAAFTGTSLHAFNVSVEFRRALQARRTSADLPSSPGD